jgi:hypothetical protein
MNDPFDVYIEDLFNVSLEQLQGQSVADLPDLLQRDPGRFQELVGADPSEVSRVSTIIRSILPQERPAHFAAITAALLEECGETLAEMRRSLELERQQVIAQFESTAIFCITRDRDNLLMWAHYAQQHRGVVLGFRPDIAVDEWTPCSSGVRPQDALAYERSPKFCWDGLAQQEKIGCNLLACAHAGHDARHDGIA